ncbi:MAG: glycosyltransferase family 39 protein [Elusimicrobia bacterium]|nr:glycosyltransferase family 39 protein [Elusimicrobiota bacterium]
MIGIFIVVLTITACYSLGFFLNSIILSKINVYSRFEKTIFNIVIGIGILAFIVFFLGISGLIYASIFWVILAALNILAAYLFFSNARSQKFEMPIFSVLEKVVIILIVLSGISHIVLSFRPVTNLDALSHLVLLPKSYIFKHAIYNLTREVPFSTYPQLLGMLDTFVMALADEIAVNHLHLLIGFLTCGLIYLVGKKTVNRTAGLLSVLTIITSSVFFDMASIAKIDIGIAFYTAAILYALVKWEYEKNSIWFYVSIAFCALSFGVKYNGAFLLILPAVFYVSQIWKEGKISAELIRLIPLSAAVYLLLLSPWLIMNYAFTGNPLSPFLAKILGDRSQLPEMSGSISSYFEKASSGYFTYPKDVLLGMPILFFAFFIKLIKNKAAVLALISGALYFLIGDFFLLHADRVFFPAFILFFFVIGNVIHSAKIGGNKIIRYFILTVYFAMIVYSLYAIINEILRKENFPYFSGKESKTEFLKRDVTSYPITIPANKLIPRGEYLWSLAESRGYYFDQKFIQGFSYITTDITRGNSPESIIEGMEKYNIKYVLFSREPYFLERQHRIFNEGTFLAENFDLVANEGYCSIYKLKHE